MPKLLPQRACVGPRRQLFVVAVIGSVRLLAVHGWYPGLVPWRGGSRVYHASRLLIQRGMLCADDMASCPQPDYRSAWRRNPAACLQEKPSMDQAQGSRRPAELVRATQRLAFWSRFTSRGTPYIAAWGSRRRMECSRRKRSRTSRSAYSGSVVHPVSRHVLVLHRRRPGDPPHRHRCLGRPRGV
jgi:hypothetical protein